jgi:cyclophilin family peptidyl-prolyl cis-trans isomerase
MLPVASALFLRRAAVAPTLSSTVRALSSRGSRGHGWYTHYRAGEGGRHLQGEYHDRPSLSECQAWNQAVLGLRNNNNNNNNNNSSSSPLPTRVWLDVAVEQKGGAVADAAGARVVPPLESLTAPLQRLEFDMAPAVTVETCHNFCALVQNKDYDGSLLYRFEKQVGLCGGDILTNTGDTGRSFLPDRLAINVAVDPLALWHVPGTVSMLVSTVDEVDSRFFFCTAHSPHLDGIHRAFGQLTHASLELVQEWQNTLLTRDGGVPTTYDMIVVRAGLVEPGLPLAAAESTEATAAETLSASASS